MVRVPLATNTVVVNFEQLAANMLDTAVDVILLDTTFWGGIRPCVKAAAVCETFQLGVAVHSSGELGIQLATMLHLGAVLPNLSFAADAHYHHLADDIIQGGFMSYTNGAIQVPEGPGLGVTLDRENSASTTSCIGALGNYPYDRDPGRMIGRPWFPTTAGPIRTMRVPSSFRTRRQEARELSQKRQFLRAEVGKFGNTVASALSGIPNQEHSVAPY